MDCVVEEVAVCGVVVGEVEGGDEGVAGCWWEPELGDCSVDEGRGGLIEENGGAGGFAGGYGEKLDCQESGRRAGVERDGKGLWGHELVVVAAEDKAAICGAILCAGSVSIGKRGDALAVAEGGKEGRGCWGYWRGCDRQTEETEEIRFLIEEQGDSLVLHSWANL